MIGLVLPWALVAACAAAGAWAYALVRQERAAYRGRVLSDRGLYEAGEAAATERKKPKLPRLARALHEAGARHRLRTGRRASRLSPSSRFRLPRR